MRTTAIVAAMVLWWVFGFLSGYTTHEQISLPSFDERFSAWGMSSGTMAVTVPGLSCPSAFWAQRKPNPCGNQPVGEETF